MVSGAAVVAGAVAGASVVAGAAVVVADKSFVLCLFRELFFDSFNLFLFCLAEVVGAVTDGAAVVDGTSVVTGAAVVVADKSFVLCLFCGLFDSFNLFLFCLTEVVGAVTDGAVLIDEAAVFAESAVVDGAAVIDGALCLPSCLLG